MRTELEDAMESLQILEETERFLVQEVGSNLTLDRVSQWVEDLAQTREMIADHRRIVAELIRVAGEGRGE